MNYQLLVHIKEINAKYWSIKTYIIIFNDTLSLYRKIIHITFLCFSTVFALLPVTIQFRGVPAININIISVPVEFFSFFLSLSIELFFLLQLIKFHIT